MLDKSNQRPTAPLALREAENSIFQGGSPTPKQANDARNPFGEQVDPARYRGQRRDKPAPGRGVRRDPGARRRLESLFKGGGDES